MNFEISSSFSPTGDQPEAIAALSEGIKNGVPFQTLLGVTGSGKTFTIANVIKEVQRPTLILSHNKTLAAQLYGEFKAFFPNNAVEYFVSYYDYYQPEAYLPSTDTYIEKDLAINEEIDKLRLRATASLLSGRKDVIVVSSVSCLYGMADPTAFAEKVTHLERGMRIDRDKLLRRFVDALYVNNKLEFKSGCFRVNGDTVDIFPAIETFDGMAYRIEIWDDEIDRISSFNPLTGAEYDAIHGCWCKAIKVLPYFCVVHKQDWFIKERYKPELQKDDMSFLSRSFERHFNERPYLKHSCYLYLTKTTKERNRMQSNFSTLCRGHIIPKELDRETAGKFMEAAEQFERIMNDSGFVRLRRLSTDELVGTEKSAGLIERYFSLMPEGDTALQDIDLSAREMRIGDNRLCLHTLSNAEDMPGKVATDIRYEKLSTDRSDCRLSFASPVGLLLSCNHIYNQYVRQEVV